MTAANAMKVAVVGAGWAGLAAAVAATQAGHQVSVFEAAPTLGGRARALHATLPDGTSVVLDNGQHLLIGAYTQTLDIMQRVGALSTELLLRRALSLPFADGSGLHTPDWAAQWIAPLDALAAIARARGWRWSDRLALLRAALAWRAAGFRCASDLTVAQLCHALPARVLQQLIEPLCVSALNTASEQASAQVFLRVLQDALFGVRGGSHLLLPRVDLGSLFPQCAVQWLQTHGAHVATGKRVRQLHWCNPGWRIGEQTFERVVWASDASNAARAMSECALGVPPALASALREWAALAADLRFEAIATVYLWGEGVRLDQPMLALYSTAQAPSQFVFDRGQLGGPTGLLAFVVSASAHDAAAVQAAVLQQAQDQLGLRNLQVVQTVVEKRATFACTPGLRRPAQTIAPGLLAAGDYVAGPYPATLEGAVRSGWSAGS